MVHVLTALSSDRHGVVVLKGGELEVQLTPAQALMTSKCLALGAYGAVLVDLGERLIERFELPRDVVREIALELAGELDA